MIGRAGRQSTGVAFPQWQPGEIRPFFDQDHGRARWLAPARGKDRCPYHVPRIGSIERAVERQFGRCVNLEQQVFFGRDEPTFHDDPVIGWCASGNRRFRMHRCWLLHGRHRQQGDLLCRRGRYHLRSRLRNKGLPGKERFGWFLPRSGDFSDLLARVGWHRRVLRQSHNSEQRGSEYQSADSTSEYHRVCRAGRTIWDWQWRRNRCFGQRPIDGRGLHPPRLVGQVVLDNRLFLCARHGDRASANGTVDRTPRFATCDGQGTGTVRTGKVDRHDGILATGRNDSRTATSSVLLEMRTFSRSTNFFSRGVATRGRLTPRLGHVSRTPRLSSRFPPCLRQCDQGDYK